MDGDVKPPGPATGGVRQARTRRTRAAVVEAADHTVTVEVVDGDTGTRLPDAHVRLGVHRGVTGETGLAALRAPKGTYQIGIWKTGYRPAAVTVEVTENLTIRIATSAIPDTSIWQDD